MLYMGLAGNQKKKVHKISLWTEKLMQLPDSVVTFSTFKCIESSLTEVAWSYHSRFCFVFQCKISKCFSVEFLYILNSQSYLIYNFTLKCLVLYPVYTEKLTTKTARPAKLVSSAFTGSDLFCCKEKQNNQNAIQDLSGSSQVMNFLKLYFLRLSDGSPDFRFVTLTFCSVGPIWGDQPTGEQLGRKKKTVGPCGHLFEHEHWSVTFCKEG